MGRSTPAFGRRKKSMDMPGTGRTGNDELHDSRWLGAILPILLGYLQLLISGNAAAAARFDSVIASSLSFTIALIALTASIPIPPSKGLKICIFHLVLGCVIPLSSALPNVVCWLPFLSCIRPSFHLLPPRLQLRILHFSQILWDAIKCYVNFLLQMLPGPFQLQIEQISELIREFVTVDAIRDAQPSPPAPAPAGAHINLDMVEHLQILQISESSWNFIREFVTVDASRDAQSSPPAPAPANINLDIVEHLHDGITNIASTSLEGVHVHPLENLNSL